MSGVALYLPVVVGVCLLSCNAVDFDDRSLDADKVSHIRSIASSGSNQCTRAGTKCSDDCFEIIECKNTGTHLEPISTICGYRKCNPYNNYTCSMYEVPCPSFTCVQDGVYPDVLDCGIYHVCRGKTDTVILCNNGYAYDPSVKDCVLANGTTLCDTTPVPECLTQSQTDVLDSDPTIYYDCTEYIPKLHRCENNFQFNTLVNKCDNSSVACTGGPGNYLDPYNCNKYFSCKSAGRFPTHKTCPDEYFFDGSSGKCTPGTCGT